MATESAAKPQKFKAEVSQVLSLVINSLYSNKDIFLRELVSNAADALDKRRFESIAKPKLTPEGHEPRIRLIPDREAGTLTIWDNGIGMGKGALAKDLGTVARSGTKEFAKKLEEATQQAEQGELSLIGQFGVGFYSGYLVADSIDVVSRGAGSADAHRWSSDGQESFTIEATEREEPGTSVVLHLKDEQKKYLEEYELRNLVRTYSDFIDYPIELLVDRKGGDDDGDDDGDEPQGPHFESINRASALWTRPKSEISDEQYEELYKHLSHDWEPPLCRAHFSVEGTQMFTGLLFVPKRAPFDMLAPQGESEHGVRLYVRRIFIMDNCKELLPRWLRFVRGVIDSDDLPLNVSRELLQDSAIVRVIRKQVIRRVLDALGTVAKDSPEQYAGFWNTFGAVFKEGLHFDADQKDKIAPLLRYESSGSEGLTSLPEYVERMAEGQEKIYYALGPSSEMLLKSPHLEGLKAKDYEVLFMTDGVDQWAVEGLQEFGGKPLVNAMEADLDLGDDGKSEDDDKEGGELSELRERCKQVLEEHVSEVRVSSRLTDSPACLVLPKGGLPAHLERMIRSYQQDLPTQKRILELNPSHALIKRMESVRADEPESDKLTEWIEMLYDQALLSEGSPLPDPTRFASRVATLMEQQG